MDPPLSIILDGLRSYFASTLIENAVPPMDPSLTQFTPPQGLAMYIEPSLWRSLTASEGQLE
jgi:hypothetical protein